MTDDALGVAERDPQGNFLGIVGGNCGEHRTVGDYRAWCHDCSSWCYPGDPCYGCAEPITSARIESLVGENLALQTSLAAALQVIEDVRKLAEQMDRAAWRSSHVPEYSRVCRDLAQRLLTITDKETTT